jgi:hypothetical protein
MVDKVITAIAQVWMNDDTLKELLSETPEGYASIHDRWVEPSSKFPYLCYRWEMNEGDHWAKRDNNLVVDIFDKGSSSINIENIRNRIIEITDRKQFESDESGPIRLYLGGDVIVPEDDNEVVHWNITFRVIFWRKDFISKLID